jgi:hypothetical protein
MDSQCSIICSLPEQSIQLSTMQGCPSAQAFCDKSLYQVCSINNIYKSASTALAAQLAFKSEDLINQTFLKAVAVAKPSSKLIQF